MAQALGEERGAGSWVRLTYQGQPLLSLIWGTVLSLLAQALANLVALRRSDISSPDHLAGRPTSISLRVRTFSLPGEVERR